MVPPNFDFKNKGNTFLCIILGADHESELRILISCHLGKVLPAFTMKKNRGGPRAFLVKNFSGPIYSSFDAA